MFCVCLFGRWGYDNIESGRCVAPSGPTRVLVSGVLLDPIPVLSKDGRRGLRGELFDPLFITQLNLVLLATATQSTREFVETDSREE